MYTCVTIGKRRVFEFRRFISFVRSTYGHYSRAVMACCVFALERVLLWDCARESNTDAEKYAFRRRPKIGAKMNLACVYFHYLSRARSNSVLSCDRAAGYFGRERESGDDVTPPNV